MWAVVKFDRLLVIAGDLGVAHQGWHPTPQKAWDYWALDRRIGIVRRPLLRDLVHLRLYRSVSPGPGARAGGGLRCDGGGGARRRDQDLPGRDDTRACALFSLFSGGKKT